MDESDEQATDLEDVFEAAAAIVASIAGSDSLKTDALLHLYGLYKQATSGPCDTFRPSFFDRKARAKWAAWKRLGELPSDEAKLQYIGLVKSACPDYDGAQQGKPQGGGPGGPVFSSLADGPEDSQNGPPLGSLHLLASEDDLPALTFLLDNGADINQRDDEGCTALHWAADRGSMQALKLLVSRGAALNAKDADGQTPMHYAALSEHEEACAALVKAGADPSLRDSAGKRPQDIDDHAAAWGLWQAHHSDDAC